MNLDVLRNLIPGAPLWLVCVLLLLPMLPNIWGIWHSGTRRFNTPQEQMGWISLNTLLPCLGGLIYIFVGRKRSMPPLPPEKDAARTNWPTGKPR